MSSPQTVEHTGIHAALTSAQTDMGPLYKNATNPHFRSKYANLNSIFDLIREPLQENGLALNQTMEIRDGKNVLCTNVTHISTGEYVSQEAYLPAIDDPQKIGSAITYYRRYQLLCVFNLNAEDDDGNEASRPAQQQTERATTPILRKTPPKMEIWQANVGTAQLNDDPNKRKAALATLGREAAQSAWPTTYATYLTESVGEEKFTGWVNGLIEEANDAADKSPDVIEETPF